MARSFNGSSDLMAADAAAGFSEQNPYSVAFWINAATPGAAANCYTEGRSTTSNPFLQIGCGSLNRSRVTMSIRNDAGGGSQVNAVLSASTLFDGTWRHFGFAQDGAATCAYATYFNGVLDATLKGTYASGTTTIDRLGLACARLNTNSKFMACSMAHVAVWHRQLSAAEFAALAAGLPPSHLGPTHYWPLWGADSPEPDIGASAHVAGTLTGTSQAAGGPPVARDLIVLRAPSGSHAPAAGQSVAFGKAAETDVARSFTWKRSLAFGKATETDTARAASAAKRLAFGRALETDTAHSFTAAKRLTFGQATETDTAYSFSKSQGFNVGQAAELDIAYQITWTKRLAFGKAAEASTAYHFTTHLGVDAVPVYTKRTRATAGGGATVAATGRGRTRTSTNSGVTDA